MMRRDDWIKIFVPPIATSFLVILITIWRRFMLFDYFLFLIPFALIVLMFICINYFSESEEQEKDNKTRFARRSLKKYFKRFLSFWELNAKSFSQVNNNISRDKWMEIETIAKKLKEIVEFNEISLNDEIENEANENVDDVVFSSKRIRAIAHTKINFDMEKDRRKSLVISGNEYTKKIGFFIKKYDKIVN